MREVYTNHFNNKRFERMYEVKIFIFHPIVIINYSRDLLEHYVTIPLMVFILNYISGISIANTRFELCFMFLLKFFLQTQLTQQYNRRPTCTIMLAFLAVICQGPFFCSCKL